MADTLPTFERADLPSFDAPLPDFGSANVPDFGAIDIKPQIGPKGSFLPSQFSGGGGMVTPPSQNPDWDFTAATGGSPPLALMSKAAGLVPKAAVAVANIPTAIKNAVSGQPPGSYGYVNPIPENIPHGLLPINLPLAGEENQGIIPELSRFAEGMEQPGNALSLPLAGESKLVQSAFMASADQQVAQGMQELGTAKTPDEVKSVLTKLAVNSGMAALMARGGKKAPEGAMGTSPTPEAGPVPETAPAPAQAPRSPIGMNVGNLVEQAMAKTGAQHVASEFGLTLKPGEKAAAVNIPDDLSRYSPEDRAKLEEMKATLPTVDELTDRQRGSPTEGMTIHPKRGASADEVRAMWKQATEGYTPIERRQAVAPEPISVGPGAASPGDVPPEPPQAAASDASTAEPSNPVATPSAPIITRIRNAFENAITFAKGASGNSMPKTTAANQAAGEAGVRYASSRGAARPIAQIFSAHTLEGTDVDPVKFGAALTEDNLRSVREGFRQQATELRADGKPDESAAAEASANKVTSLIGAEGSPFKTEDEYQDFLNEPGTKRAIQQHIQQWNEIVEPMYKQAMSLDPEVELPTRGQQTGARINLKAVFPEDEAPAMSPVGGGGNLTGTFKRKSPFGIKAKGTGEVYEAHYPEIMANTFEKQLEIANKNAFDRALVESGKAVVDKPGKRVVIDGQPAVAFPLSRRLITTTKGTFPAGQNIYVSRKLASEYRAAANIDPRMTIPGLTPAMNVLNRAALAGLTDFTVHTSNLATALFNRPITGKLLTDSLLSIAGRADAPVAFIKALIKASQDNSEQLAELAKIGALRPELALKTSGPLGWTGSILKAFDRTVRLTLDDAYKNLVEQGLVEDSETARREYVNQIGQYNRRLQGPAMRLLRDTGFGPFATAGRTFNAMGVKMATLSPSVPASGTWAAIALRANVLSKWVGASVLIGSLNYVLTHSKGGGIFGRPGTKLGSVDTGTDDKNGRPLSVPALDIIGLGRALRVTGARGAIDAKRMGLTNQDALDSAGRDIINSAIGPAAGPPVRFGMTALSGYPPAINVGRSAPVAPPGQSQFAVNAQQALKDANPVIGSIFDWKSGKSIPEIMSRQLPRFTLSPGKPPEMVANYPVIVGLAQTHAYADYVVSTARKMAPDQRNKFIMDSLKSLTPEQQKMVADSLRRRKVIH